MKIHKRPQFLIDLAKELTWLRDKADVEVGERWYSALLETIRFIQKHPLIGRERNDWTPAGIRYWRIQGFPRWLIFYAEDSGGNIILYRVRSGTMNLVVMKMKS